MFDCPYLSEIRAQFPGLFQSLTGAPYWWTACYSVLKSQAGCNGRVTSPPFFFFQDAAGASVCSCGTRTRSLSAIISLPCCKRFRHEHNPVLMSQTGRMDVVNLSLSLSLSLSHIMASCWFGIAPRPKTLQALDSCSLKRSDLLPWWSS